MGRGHLTRTEQHGASSIAHTEASKGAGLPRLIKDEESARVAPAGPCEVEIAQTRPGRISGERLLLRLLDIGRHDVGTCKTFCEGFDAQRRPPDASASHPAETSGPDASGSDTGSVWVFVCHGRAA
jgi:hypothetical protein